MRRPRHCSSSEWARRRSPDTVGGPAEPPPPGPPRAVLPVLCVSQVISWGVLYYAFPVMLPRVVTDTGWAAAPATVGFSLALVLSALVGVGVGRVIDARGPRVVMSVGAALGAGSLVLVAVSTSLTAFLAAWASAGVAMACTFYPAAFAALAHWYGAARVRALTVVTLAGGLASTVFAPTTALLLGHLAWREVVLVLAAVLLLVVAPLHWFGLAAPWPDAPGVDGGRHPVGTSTYASSITTSRPFLLLAGALTLSGFALYAVVFGLVPLLVERGVTASTAAWALGLGGLGQTLGRGLYGLLVRATGVMTRTVVLIGAGGLCTLLLAVVRGPVPLVFALALLAGMVRGNLTLLQATAVVDRWGPRDYGRLAGILGAPVTMAAAVAPWAGAALAGWVGGHAQLFVGLGAVSGVAAVLALLAGSPPGRRTDEASPTRGEGTGAHEGGQRPR